MKRGQLGWWGLGLCIVMAVSCSEDSDPTPTRVCTPGETQPCVGPGQCDGGQACNADGSAWGACECGVGGSGGAAGTGGTAGQGGSAAAGGSGGESGQGGGGGQGGDGGAGGSGGSGGQGGTAGTGGQGGTAGTGGQGGTAGTGGQGGVGGAPGGSGGVGGGGVCEDRDLAGWVGGGPGCYGVGGAGGGASLGGGTPGFDAPDTSGSAVWVGEISDDDDCGAVIEGVINGTADVDWYYYHGVDQFLAIVSPSRDRGVDQDLVMCAYMECDDGQTPDVVCTNSSPDVEGTGGGAMNGCCTDGDVTDFDMDTTIGGSCSALGLGDDSAYVYIKVSGELVSANACVEYGIAFNF